MIGPQLRAARTASERIDRWGARIYWTVWFIAALTMTLSLWLK